MIDGIFCRKCGYDLRATENRCPECGRAFDRSKPRTFRKRPPRGSLFRWTKRIVVVLVVLTLAWGSGVLWLYQEWKVEQREVAAMQGMMLGPDTPLYPWLPKLLPGRWEFIADRVTGLWARNATDTNLERLTSLRGLQWLDLESTQVTDAGLEQLKDLKGLRLLRLRSMQVTDAGLEHLKDLKGLQMLDLVNTKVTDAGVAKLKTALPNCQIVH